MGKLLINNNIRKLRFLNDEMTQSELASKVEVSRQTIVAIEKGNYSPSLELAFKLADAFDKSIDEIFNKEKKDENK
jgi:putative transcriptional regulator